MFREIAAEQPQLTRWLRVNLTFSSNLDAISLSQEMRVFAADSGRASSSANWLLACL